MQHLDKGMEPNGHEPEYDTEEILHWVVTTYLPEELYSYAALENWALRNNWILPDNNNTTKDY